MFNGGWNFGSLCMVGLAYLIRSWNYLQVTFASIGLLLLGSKPINDSTLLIGNSRQNICQTDEYIRPLLGRSIGERSCKNKTVVIYELLHGKLFGTWLLSPLVGCWRLTNTKSQKKIYGPSLKLMEGSWKTQNSTRNSKNWKGVTAMVREVPIRRH